MLLLPYTARNELRGNVRRYVRLLGGMAWSSQLAEAHLVDLVRFTVAGFAPAGSPPLPAIGALSLGSRWADHPDAPVAPLVDAVASALGVGFSAKGGAARARKPLHLLHNSAVVHGVLREVFSGETFSYDASQRNPNVWSCFGQPSPRAPAWRTRHFLRSVYPLGALYRIYEFPLPDTTRVVSALLQHEAPGKRRRVSDAEAHTRARQWMGLFGVGGRFVVSTPDPQQPLRGSFSCEGYIGNAAAVVGMSADRIGLLMRLWGGMAD